MNKKDISESEYYRQTVVTGSSKKALPLVLIVTILFIGGIMLTRSLDSFKMVNEYGIGDPYHCRECKELKFACKEHRGYNSGEALKDMLERYSYGFIPGMSENEQRKLMYGAEYNLECDFCTEKSTECYGCSSDRELINDKLEAIEKDEVFKSKLNNEDWKLGYANSSDGRAMLLRELKNTFSKEALNGK